MPPLVLRVLANSPDTARRVRWTTRPSVDAACTTWRRPAATRDGGPRRPECERTRRANLVDAAIWLARSAPDGPLTRSDREAVEERRRVYAPPRCDPAGPSRRAGRARVDDELGVVGHLLPVAGAAVRGDQHGVVPPQHCTQTSPAPIRSIATAAQLGIDGHLRLGRVEFRRTRGRRLLR